MKSFFSASRRCKQDENPGKGLVHLHIQDYDRNEIGEFLDESLRMKDQPFPNTEAGPDAGIPASGIPEIS